MFMFFVNKPISIVFYLIGLAFTFLLAINGKFEPVVSFLTGVFSFSILYFLILIRYYVFSGEEIIFLGVEMNKFKMILNVFIFLNASVFILLNLLIPKMGFFAPFFLFGYTVLSMIILERIVMSKFITEGIKHNKTIKDLKFDELYQDFRAIFIKKLIEEEEEEN